MERTIKVSIIIPIYNVEKYLRECVDSVISQTHENIEVILVDDGSRDTCPAICDEYAARDARVCVVHKKNGGLSSARRAGLEHVSGEYVIFVDGDDRIDAETVEECLDVAVRQETDCVMFGYIREYPTKSFENYLFDEEFSFDADSSERFVHRKLVGPVAEELGTPQRVDNYSTVCMKLYAANTARRGLIVSEREVGTGEDTVFNLYALDNCKIAYINKCFYHYRKTNDASIVASYKSDLAEKWDVLYGVISEYIESSGRHDEYKTPFLNRVACGTIGLGLNEASDGAPCKTVSKRMRRILEKPLYIEAFSKLDTSHCGAKWKLFFLLCKRRATYPLAVLLKLMNVMKRYFAA